MDAIKRQRLEAAGWKVGTAADFLELSQEEIAIVELKLALSQRLKDVRVKRNISQVHLAKLMRSSQSRVAKIEAGDPSVSIDLLMRALFCTGVTRQEVAEVIAHSGQSCSNYSDEQVLYSTR